MRTRAALKHRSVEAAPVDTFFSLRQPLALSDRARAPVWLAGVASRPSRLGSLPSACRADQSYVAGRSTVPG